MRRQNCGASEGRRPARNPALGGQGSTGSHRVGRGRVAESGNSQEIPFHSGIPPPLPWVPTSLDPEKEKMKCFSGFPASLLQPLAFWGLERAWERRTPARRSSGPSRG